MKCELCARKCNVDRSSETGYCGMSDRITIARAALHMYEEPCITGDGGSGAIFFTGCSLGCVYCQNHKIAEGKAGLKISEDRLLEIFFELKDKGAENINLVTPTHYIPEIRRTIIRAKEKGFDLPFVYNTGGYDDPKALRTLEGLIDIYLPDFKYMDEELAALYSNAPDYPKAAFEAISEMVRQVKPEYNEEGRLKKGVIVRHLVLPGSVKNSIKVLDFLKEHFGDDILISLMNQYTPMPHLERDKYPKLTRKVTKREYDKVVDHALDIGLENGFFQEGDTAKESFIPDFDLK